MMLKIKLDVERANDPLIRHPSDPHRVDVGARDLVGRGWAFLKTGETPLTPGPPPWLP